MFKKFIEGLAFGGGFAISFIAVWSVAVYFIFPVVMTPRIEREAIEYPPQFGEKIPSIGPLDADAARESAVPFYDLGLEEQIKHSSVIALAKYEQASDGKMKAIIKEFLKKSPDVTIYYNIGDEYPSSSYYPKDNTNYGEGTVIFFTGSPATMKMSMSYSGDRIRSLGDLPVELFRKKCKEPDAQAQE